jgi:hypothetical protein
VPDRLYFTESDEANALNASDPMALLIGFALDQQVTVQKAFMGPLVLRERLGSIDADTLASADLEPVFRTPPAIHRFPGSMAQRVHELAVHVRDRYDGEAARIWTQGAGRGARQAVRRGGGPRPRAVASDPRRRRLPAGAGRLPGRQARPQGGVDEGARVGLPRVVRGAAVPGH